MIRRFKIGYDVELHKRTLEQALLSLVGPRAREVAGADDRRARARSEHDNARSPRASLVTHRRRRRRDLRRRGRRRRARARSRPPAPSRSPRPPPRSCASSAAGRATASTSTTTVIPQEAGLNERAVSFTKGCYVGQETVARLFYKGKPNRHLRGLRPLRAGRDRGAAAPRRARGRPRWARVVVSPRFGAVALALVRREAEPGDMLSVGDGDVDRRGPRAAVRLVS